MNCVLEIDMHTVHQCIQVSLLGLLFEADTNA